MELFLITGTIISKKENIISIQELPDESTDSISSNMESQDICSNDPHVYTVTIKREYHDIFKSSMIGDLVKCNLIEEWSSSGDECVLYIHGWPLITRSLVDKKSTISSMIASVRYEGKLRVPIYKLINIYEYIDKNICNQLQNNHIHTVSSYLSYKANQLKTGDRMTVISSILLHCPGNITFTDMDYLLKGWYIKNDIRLLKAVGFDEEIIKESYINPYTLYEKYTKNPLLVYCAPMELAIKACDMLVVDISNYREAGKVIRQLAKCTIENSNTCTNCKNFYTRQDITNDTIDKILKEAVVYEKIGDESSDVLYLSEVRDMEEAVAQYFAKLMTSIDTPAIPKRCKESNSTLVYDEEQENAVETALTKNVSIITGAAGTGKTTIIKKIISILKLNDIAFACTSFTGKATARICECCDVDAVDMDMMIVQRELHHFDHLIIDEFSMTNLHLMYRFFCAFPGTYRLTIIGDPNQLEPIGPGSVLSELINSNTIPVIKLRVIYRVVTEEGCTDKIIENSKRIAYWEDKPFSFVEGDNFQIKDGNIKTLVEEIKSFNEKKIPTENFVVISPYNEPLPLINRVTQIFYNSNTKCAVKQGNKWLVLKNGDQDLDTARIVYHINDRIMILKSDSKIGIFNGQEGIIKDITTNGVTVSVNKGSGSIDINFPYSSPQGKKNITYISLCYGVSTHKMQGSQRKNVIYFLHKYSKHVTRRMTYTAITRAQSNVLMIGKPEDFNKSVENMPSKKSEYLYWRLRKYLPQDYIPKKDDQMMKELQERQALLNLLCEQEYGDYGGDDDYDYYSD
jgi:hypothetical protein